MGTVRASAVGRQATALLRRWPTDGTRRALAASPDSVLGRAPVIVILALGCLLRLIHLDADPDYYAWIGYVTDEGRWIQNARDVVLFGHVVDPRQAHHVHLAPLFHLTHLLFFKLVGISFVTTRILTAVSGCALLFVVWIFLRRVATREALVIAVLLLAFEVDLVMMSRVAVPEVPAMLFQLVAFAVIVTPPASMPRMVTGGLCLLLAVATKVTVLPVVPIFAVIAVLMSGPGARRRLRNLAMVGAGLVVPVIPVALLWLVRQGGDVEGLRGTSSIVRPFLAPPSLYEIASLPFEATLAPLFNVWGMAVCLTFVGWAATSRSETSSTVRHWYMASLIWLGAYSVVMMSLAYFPDRYRVHLLVPLALNVAAGITLFQQIGLTGATERLRRMAPTRRLAVWTVVGLPTAVFAAPVLASGYHLVGGDATRLRVAMVAVAVALVVTVAMLDRRVQRGGSPLPFLVFPVTAALAWLASSRLGLTDFPFWPAPEHGPWTWALGEGWAAAAVAWAVTGLARRRPSWRRPAMVTAAVMYAVLSVVRVLPSYVTPRYTMKQTSENLGRELAGFHGVVATGRAESLFIANRVRYRNTPNHGVPPDAFVVVAFAPSYSKSEREYRVAAEYELFISPSYVPIPSDGPRFFPPRLPVRVYVRRDP